MAKKKKKPKIPVPKPPLAKVKPKHVRQPVDYLRGGGKDKGRTVGENYTAWNTYGQGKPDFGKGKGPGEPYHEVNKKVQAPMPGPKGKQSPPWATLPRTKPGTGTLPFKRPGTARPSGNDDARIAAIRRRLQGVK